MTTSGCYAEKVAHSRENTHWRKTVTLKTGEATADYIIQTLRSNSLDTEKLFLSIIWFHMNSISGHLGGAKRKLDDKLDIFFIKYK